MMVTKPDYPYSFNPCACETCSGRCCNGESGNIWVNRKEIEAIARFLSMDNDLFITTYLRKSGYRFTIKELKSKENYACVFFDETRNGCAVYEARPEQCRTFPFWPYFKDHPEEAAAECPGVNVD